MKRIRRTIRRKIAAVLAACMVTTSFPEVAFGAQNQENALDENNIIVLHLDGDKLKTAAQDALKNGKQFTEKLDFYMEDGSEEQTKLYRQLFEEGCLYEISLKDTYAATPSNAAEKGTITLLVRPDGDIVSQATASDATVSDATDSDAALADYQITGSEQVIVLFRNDSDQDWIYQIEISGSLSPEIKVPAGETLVAETASPSDSVEAEEPASDGGEEAVQLPADDGIPSAPSTPENGHIEDGNNEGQGQQEDAWEPSNSENSEKPSDSEDNKKPSDSENNEKPSESEDKEKPSDSENNEKPSESEDKEKPSDSENKEKPSDSEDKEKPSDSEDSQNHSDPESFDREDGKTENSDETQKKENSGNSDSSNGEEDKSAFLSISRYSVPRVTAKGPSGEEYPDDYDPYNGMTPEEAWEEFQENGDEEAEENAKEEVHYEDELSAMSEETATGMKGTVLEPVLVKTRRNKLAKIARVFLGSDRPTGAAVYVSTLDEMVGRNETDAESEFTVDLFDYGTFDSRQLDSERDEQGGILVTQANQIKDFNKLLKNGQVDYENQTETGFFFLPGTYDYFADGGASQKNSLVRGIVESTYPNDQKSPKFRDTLPGLEEYGNTIFPDKKYDSKIQNNEKLKEQLKIYRDVVFPMTQDETNPNHYSFSSKDTFVTGSVSEGKWKLEVDNNYNGKQGDRKSDFRNGKGFWPLNNTDSEESNQFFGMKLSADFYLPKDGTLNDEALEFSFTGDDDVWVFIDGKLVLDIGGLHTDNTVGTINFKTGFTEICKTGNYNIVDENNSDRAEGDKVYGYIYSESDDVIKEQAEKNNINPDDIEKARSLEIERGKVHTLDLYLVERCAYGSNCMIDFTLPVLPKGGLNLIKKVEGDETPEADSLYKFELKRKDSNSWNDFPNSNISVKAEEVKNIVLEPGEYLIRETESQGAETITWTGGEDYQYEGDNWRKFVITPEGNNTLICTNSFINKDQTHSLIVTKDVEGENTSADVKFPFEIQLTLPEDKTGEGVAYQIGDGSPSPVLFNGKEAVLSDILLADGESVKIKNLPYETSYRVEENLPEDSLYDSLGAEEKSSGTITTEDIYVRWKNQRKSISTTAFTVEKQVADEQNSLQGEAEDYVFALYTYPKNLTKPGEYFWEPYTGSCYVNGQPAEKFKEGNEYGVEKGTVYFTLHASSDKSGKALIELPVSEKNSTFMIREIDRGETNCTEWKVQEESVTSLDSSAFRPQEVENEMLICRNIMNPFSIKIEKELTEGSEKVPENTLYTFTVLINGKEEKTESIPAGGSFTVEGLKAGDTYSISENIPSVLGFEGRLESVTGSEWDKLTATGTVGTGEERETIDKNAYAVQLRMSAEPSEAGKMPVAELYIIPFDNESSVPDWQKGTPVLKETGALCSEEAAYEKEAEKVYKRLIQDMLNTHSAPYALEDEDSYYQGEMLDTVQPINIMNFENLGLDNGFEKVSWSDKMLICDGRLYQSNEYMKYDIKEKLQKNNAGTITSIESTGYQMMTYSFDDRNISNAAGIRLTMELEKADSSERVITFYNTWKKSLTDFTIKKEISEPDTETNTFLFQITGPDQSVFYTGIIIPAGETTGERKISGVPVGLYQVEELDHMRYDPKKAILEKEITAVPEGDSNLFTFTNTKVSFGYFSDTSSILNMVNTADSKFDTETNEDSNAGNIHRDNPDAILTGKESEDNEDSGDTAEN